MVWTRCWQKKFARSDFPRGLPMKKRRGIAAAALWQASGSVDQPR
jgi:hypothetical protein